MNERERTICARVKEFREAIKWPQIDFAAQLGINLNQLAGIEYRRTPLRYDIAWQIRSNFGPSLSWLATGHFPPQAKDLDPWPDPKKLTKGRLLSDVEASLWSGSPHNPHAGELHEKSPLQAPQRSTLLSILKDDLTDWMARVPDEKIPEFVGRLVTLSEDYLDGLPQESGVKVKQRQSALIWDTMRLDIAKRLLGKAAGKLVVDNGAASDTVSNMSSEIPTWKQIVAALKRLTKSSGAKAQLAKELKTSRQNVNKWLSGAGAPSAELTLEVFRWVENHGGWK